MSGIVLSAANSVFGLGDRGACQGLDGRTGVETSSPSYHRPIWTFAVVTQLLLLLCTLLRPGTELLAPEPSRMWYKQHTDYFPFLVFFPFFSKVGLIL